MTKAIERSTGIAIGYGFVAGGGYAGATEELDTLVQDAAEALADAYAMPVTIRFNSDRRSGGAWLKTNPVDAIGRNAEIGIGARLCDGRCIVTAHIGAAALVDKALATGNVDDPTRAYYDGVHESIEDALEFVQAHGRLEES